MKYMFAASVLFAGLASTQASAQDMQAQLTLESAATIRDACLAHAAENDMVIAIAVFDNRGMMVTYAAMDGIAAAIPDVAMWKGRSAAKYRYATSVTADWGGDAPEIAVWEGGLPIFMADGSPLGGVGVSGAASADDVACIMAGVEAAGLVTELAAD
ncbi:heme-binding protein [Parvularcula flava]|nr:heme-binding protein [Aquisalinus luteolus]NHK29008.1 heme-binding protein [Aquisalinus luteolus]